MIIIQKHPEVCGNIIESFKSKIKIIGKTPAACNEKDVEIMVPLKYLGNFWRTL